jgi:hypothetical protein
MRIEKSNINTFSECIMRALGIKLYDNRVKVEKSHILIAELVLHLLIKL